MPIMLALAAGAASVAQSNLAIHASRPVVVYGGQALLTGTLPSDMEDRQVVLELKEFGDRAFQPFARIDAGVDGRWRRVVQPRIETVFRARAGAVVSVPVRIRVRPRVILERRASMFFTSTTAGRTYEGGHVFLQRRTTRGWALIRRIVLRRRPRAFRVTLPPGRSRLRVYMPPREAGPGYLAGFSRTLVYRRG
jgi:hypothetical protein